MSSEEKNAMSFDDLKREALKLPLDDREDLAYSLLRSIEEAEDEDSNPDHARLWKKEIDRRYQEYKQGKAEVFDADEVIAELRAEPA
jgi:putative addiction module component (TIGR02574 family)